MTPTPSEKKSTDKRKRQDDKKGNGGSQVTKIISLVVAAKVALFHTSGADPEGFASVPVDGHHETLRIGSKAFKYWLQHLYWNKHKSAINSQAMQGAIGLLRGQALFEGPMYPVFVRLAALDGSIWLDLANEKWQAMQIDSSGWRVVDKPAVRFIRPRGMMPLPIPKRGGKVDHLRRHLNFGSEDNWRLVVAWLVATLRPNGPYPVLGVHGEQGSAKSTLCRMLRSLVDPNEVDLRSEPQDERDLMIAASNGWIIALENLSKIPPWISDALCRLSTGGGFGTRELFSDGEEKLFNAKRPIMLNGINEVVTRSDLASRSLLITLPTINDQERQTEDELWKQFEADKPKILGALLDVVASALANIGNVELECKPRMADFAVWACAAEPALGWPAGSFLNAYSRNRTSANETAIESCIVAEPFLSFMDGRNEWQGTATELLAKLEGSTDERTTKQRDWPKRPHLLSSKLRRIAPNLRAMGIDLEFGKSGRRFIQVTRTMAQSSVQSVPSVPTSSNGSTRASLERPVASEFSLAPSSTQPHSDALDAADAVDANSPTSSEIEDDWGEL